MTSSNNKPVESSLSNLSLSIYLQGMQVQNMVWLPAVITIITSIASIPINMLFIGALDFSGAALAKSATRTLQCALFCGKYTFLTNHCSLLIILTDKQPAHDL